jgi:putative intracellular protease/amidase
LPDPASSQRPRSLPAASLAASQSPAPASAAFIVDFDDAMRGLRFDPGTVDGNLDTGSSGNGMLDADELALIAAILARPDLDLKASGGIDHRRVHDAFLQARASAAADLQLLAPTWPTAADVAAGYAMLGRGSFDSYNEMSKGFNAPLAGNYALALALGQYLAFDGDADGDGVSNRVEYAVFKSEGRSAYVRAALDPAIRPTATQIAEHPVSTLQATRKTLGIVLYPGFEVLDVYGPLEMWGYVQDFKVITIAEQAGPVRSAQGVSTVAEYSFATAPPLDILMVPGGIGTRTELENPVLLDYLRRQHARTEYTTSVCTGSALLAKAGLLTGLRATSNKRAFQLAVDQDPAVHWVGKARWVEDGKVLTSSGVSAGTDMALGLIAKIYGRERAEALARSVEYEWHHDPDVDPFAIAEIPKPSPR